MKKHQLIALGIMVFAFVAFFYYGFMALHKESPIISTFCFLGFLLCTLAATFIGNSDPKPHDRH